jgi:proteasome lid subunit RPN8/RPN11
VHRCYRTRNAARSSRLYTVDPLDHLRADRDAESSGLSIIGVFHSHTHTDAYPSPTDVAQAPDPGWHYVLVSLRDELPSLRSYRIVDGTIYEEPVMHAAPVTGAERYNMTRGVVNWDGPALLRQVPPARFPSSR